MRNHIDEYKAYINGIQKRITGSIVLNGVTYTSKALVQLFQDAVDAASEKAAAKASYTTTVVTAKTKDDAARPIANALAAYVRATQGSNAAYLADFELTPRTTHKPSVATKAQAQQKAQATRQARKTMGKRQKKLIQAATNGAITQVKA